jgi:hypothetical protein
MVCASLNEGLSGLASLTLLTDVCHTGTSAGSINASYLSQGSNYTKILTEPAVLQGAIEVAALKTKVYKPQTPFQPVVRPGVLHSLCRHFTVLGMLCSEGTPSVRGRKCCPPTGGEGCHVPIGRQIPIPILRDFTPGYPAQPCGLVRTVQQK